MPCKFDKPYLFYYAGTYGYKTDNGLLLQNDNARLEVDTLTDCITVYAVSSTIKEPFIFTNILFKIGLMELLRHKGYYYVHGALVSPPAANNGWLFVGESGAGKTTITKSLVANRYRFAGDDSILLYKQPNAIKSTIAASGFPEHGKPSFSLQSYEQTIKPTDLVFPVITSDPKTQILPVSKKEALLSLLPASILIFIDNKQAELHLEFLKDLVEQCNIFQLLMGMDVKDNPDKLRNPLEKALL